MPLATLAELQREAIYGSNWLSSNVIDSCTAFQSLYEAETCCSGSLSSEYVCFKRPVAACELGWRAVTLGGLTQCLKLHPTAVWTKAEASAACASENASLVEPRTIVDDATIETILTEIDGDTVPWQFFWIGTTQHPNATVESAGWTWDSDGAALVDAGWWAGQPTNYAGAEKDGPEDCALYRKGQGWYDFACSPSASVVCMVPHFFGTCWGANPTDGFAPTGITSGGQPLCLKLLDDEAYSPVAAKTACMDLNAQLYYPTTLAENDAFAQWVYTQTTINTKVWLNIAQNKTAAGGDAGAGWTLPDGTLFGSSDGSAIPWNSPSDPEPTEPAWPSQDYLNLLVTGSDGALQPALPPPPGPPPPPAPPFYQMAAGYAWTGQELVGDAGDYGGKVLALSADGLVLAVGATNADPPDGNGGTINNAGRVVVWEWSAQTGTWVHRAVVNGEVASDGTGDAISLSADGAVLAIGEHKHDTSNAGRVRVFDWDPTGDAYVMRNDPNSNLSGDANHDYAGASVALSADGTVLASGAIGYDGSRGRVRVFVWGGGAWTQRGQDGQLDGASENDEYGYSVALSDDGTVVAIGAHAYSPTSVTNGGLARVFAWYGGAWQQRGQDILGENLYTRVGTAVDLSADGTVLAVGDRGNSIHDSPPGSHDERGRVTVYEYNAGINNWDDRGDPILGELNSDRGGYALQLSADGTVIVAGAKHNDPPDGSGETWINGGHARVWAYDGAEWHKVGVDLDGQAANGWHGYAVGISADATVVAVSAHEYPSTQGSMRVYSLQSNAMALVGNPYFTSATTIATPNADWPDGTGFAIAHSSFNPASYTGWQAFRDPVLAGDNEYGWVSDPSTSTIDEWVTITYPEPVLLQRYVLTAGKTLGDFHPPSWKMQGSNDAGASASRTWTDIGSLQIPNPAWVEHQVTEIDVSFNTVKYASYRVLCPNAANQGKDGHRMIRYIRLFTAVPAPALPPALPAPPSPPPPSPLVTWNGVALGEVSVGTRLAAPAPTGYNNFFYYRTGGAASAGITLPMIGNAGWLESPYSEATADVAVHLNDWAKVWMIWAHADHPTLSPPWPWYEVNVTGWTYHGDYWVLTFDDIPTDPDYEWANDRVYWKIFGPGDYLFDDHAATYLFDALPPSPGSPPSPFPPPSPPPQPPPAPVHGKWQDVSRMTTGAGALCVRPSPLAQPPSTPPG